MNKSSDADKKGTYIGNKMGIIYGNYFGREDLIEPITQTVKNLSLVNPRILEIGANNGIVARVVSNGCKFNSDTIVSDLNEGGLNDAPANFRKIVADNKNLPIETNGLDLILSRSVTHYERNKKDNDVVLNEVKRVLNKGGYFVNQAVCFSDNYDIEPLKYLHDLVGKEMFIQNERDVIESHRTVFGKDSVIVAQYDVGSLPGSIEDFYKRYGVNKDFIEKEMNEKGFIIPKKWEVPYKILVCRK